MTPELDPEVNFGRALFIGLLFTCLLLLCSRPSYGQAVFPYQNPKIQLLDNSGDPGSGFKLCTYAAGTTTPLATYSDTSGTLNSNPVILDASGRATVYLGGYSYKYVFLTPGSDNTCATGSTVWTQDNVTNPNLLTSNNTWSGTQIFNGAVTFNSTVALNGVTTAKSINGVLFANQYASISAAVAALGGSPGTVMVPPGNYTTSTTLTLGSGQHLVATAPCVLGQAGQTLCSSYITWTGAGSTPIALVRDAHGASIEGIGFDCANISGCIGIVYDSTNTPGSSLGKFTDISIKRFHFGFVAGLPSTTPDVNGYQADTFQVDGIQLYGNCSDLTATGIIINSANAAQQSEIKRGNLQCVNSGVRCVKSNGGLTIRQLSFGSAIGVNPTAFQDDADCAITPILIDNETEGAWTYPVHDSSNNGTASNTTWMYNQFNSTPAGSILIDGNEHLTSISNAGTNTTFGVSGGNAKVFSINEIKWTPSTDITTFTTSGSTFNSDLKGYGRLEVTSTGTFHGSMVAGQVASITGAKTGTYWGGSDATNFFSSSASGWNFGNPLSAPNYLTSTRCASSASPAVCAAAPAGFVALPAAATTLVVNTTAVGNNSQILLTEDSSLGTALSVTCNATPAYSNVSARSTGTSFTITTSSAPVTNPRCYSYFIIN